MNVSYKSPYSTAIKAHRAVKSLRFFLLVFAFLVLPAMGQQSSFWNNSTVPGTPEVTNDTSSVTLGLKFRSSAAGLVTGVRFYKGPDNTGTHRGTLWTASGAKLASVRFSGETASGWQQANFASPVSIAANTTYVVSYLAPKGYYADDQNYSWSALSASPLHVSGGSPGVYAYGSTPTFPNSTWNYSNYWVDVVFTATSSSVWPNSTPSTPEVTNDTSSVTLGLNFYSDVPGSVTAVRFYKGPHNTGAHVGTLWSGNGTSLGSVTFAGETASGWQQANFSTPVSIAANTTYVISYLAPKGYYADDQNYSWSTVSAAPLHVSGSSPGVFAYGASATFPNGTWNASNYWVDLVFVPDSPTTPAPTYSISGAVSGSAATLTLSGPSGGTTTTNSSGSYSFSGLINGTYLVAPSQSGYTFNPTTASVSVNGANATGVNFTATATPPPVQHRVSLSWTASVSPNISGYKVYRATLSGGPYTLVNGSLIAGTAYVDNTVSSGQTYYYVATAVDSSKNESGYSNQAVAAVPTP